MGKTRISALISEKMRELLERHARATGVKKGRLVEQALLHHLQAELPLDLDEYAFLTLPR